MSEVTPEQLKDLGKGGIWKNENLAQDLDWAGEQGAPSASINDEATHIPRTERQQEDQVLSLHKIAPETIAILTKRIQQSLLASGDSKDSSIVGMMERKLAEKEKEIDRWMEKKEQEMMRKEVTADEIEKLRRDLSRLEEKFETLDTRLNHNLILATKQGSEEASVLHEVRTMLKERRAVDESETGSLPSIVDRLEARTDQILNTLTIVEEEIPRAEQSITADLNVKRNVRKKFGKKF